MLAYITDPAKEQLDRFILNSFNGINITSNVALLFKRYGFDWYYRFSKYEHLISTLTTKPSDNTIFVDLDYDDEVVDIRWESVKHPQWISTESTLTFRTILYHFLQDALVMNVVSFAILCLVLWNTYMIIPLLMLYCLATVLPGDRLVLPLLSAHVCQIHDSLPLPVKRFISKGVILCFLYNSEACYLLLESQPFRLRLLEQPPKTPMLCLYVTIDYNRIRHVDLQVVKCIHTQKSG